jgi:POT family proton-dependent oligopeptide transporter
MQKNKEILGHPAGLFVLFFTEMWERFSYYGMRALLVLYMTQALFIHPETAQTVLGYNGVKHGLEAVFGPLSVQALSSQLYGLYTAFVYLTPFFGGILADRILGQRRSVYIGGVIMAIGHFLMAFENLFFLALLFLIVGNGFFKPNISTQVGSLYAEGDHRRDGAFTIFYMGINLGAFLSPLICGTLGQRVGWHYGFAAAGVGMVLGLLVYHFGRHTLPKEDTRTKLVETHQEEQPLTSDDWKKIAALIVLCTVNVLFWGVYEQQGNALQLWADTNTNWNVLGFEMPSTWFQAFNPLFIFIMGPVLISFWNWQSKRKKEPTSIAKMGIGCALAGVAFLFMVFIVHLIGGGKANILLLMMAIFIITVGELYLSPIGLSFVTKVSPPKLVSMMMGMWLGSSFFGNYLAGYIGMYYERMSQSNYFYLCAMLAFIGAGIFFVTLAPLKRITRDA